MDGSDVSKHLVFPQPLQHLTLDLDRADLSESFNINVTGPHIVTTKFLPLLRKGQAKKIVNM
jgi:NAD(P)-dependent dehydrogenase (short-subunit alcohol dehydrogenase family)